MDYVKLDSWVRGLLVDPFGKLPLIEADGLLRSTYGRSYRMVNGVFDLRRPSVNTTSDDKVWSSGQANYEQWSDALAAKDVLTTYQREIEGVKHIYEDIPLRGRVLDVGGGLGRLREFLNDDQEYLSCDPYIDVFADLPRQPNLLKAYRSLNFPCNFFACHAEHLPIAECTFDIVHMRSVIDHFRDPFLALIEAFRVLRENGQLVIGLTVEGGRSGKLSLKDVAKESLRSALPYAGIERFSDHHVWHPTFDELLSLVRSTGFEVNNVVWQKEMNDKVVYVSASKVVARPR